MKHTAKITLILILVFMLTQVAGLLITDQYIDHKATGETGNVTFEPIYFGEYELERPEVEESSSFIYILIGVLIGTGALLIIMRFRQRRIWKFWFVLSVFVGLSVAFAAFISTYIAMVAALILALYKAFKSNIYVHNVTEVFLYGGIAAIFVPIMNVFAAFMLLILISIYDAYAVWKSKHMVSLAKFQSESKLFAGLSIPYQRKGKETVSIGKATKRIKVKSAILGGGDIAFPLLFAGVVLKDLMLQNTYLIGFLKSLIVPAFAALGLAVLLIKSKEDRFYPAMPFISAGCFVGFFIVWLI